MLTPLATLFSAAMSFSSTTFKFSNKPMDSAILPTSKLDALLVVLSAIAGAGFGVSPGHKKLVAKYMTLFANAYSIYTAVATIKEMIATTTLEEHARLLMLLLTVSSIITSVLLMVVAIEQLDVKHIIVTIFYSVAGINLVGGYVILYMMYSLGCADNDDLKDTALCAHSSSAVIAALAVGAVVTLVLAGIIIRKVKTDDNYKEMIDCEAQDILAEDELPTVTLIMRLSAISKASVIALFWFLVDDDMEWEGFQGYGADWWTTGQIVKHLSSVANNFLNAC